MAESQPDVAARLVAYDEAKAGTTATDSCSAVSLPIRGEELAGEFACLDLLHRVWPAFDADAATTAARSVPEWLGDLHILREIGHGGMGIVFEAEQTSMRRRVAVKMLPAAALADRKSLQRFRNEVRAAAALDHPNIVGVYSVGEERGHHFYTMQLVRGRSLADVIAELQQTAKQASADESSECNSGNSQSWLKSFRASYSSPEFYRAAAKLAVQACQALQHAHDFGILHRDIKPGNLMLDYTGHLFVTDFGLARIEAEAGLTMTGDIVGTLRYMAPEQALARRVVIDQRADIYSFGATLYELLALQPAFAENDRTLLLNQIAFLDPTPLKKLNPCTPTDLETIVLNALNKEPDERYQTAQQMAADLTAFLEGRPIVARPRSIVDRLTSWSRRHSSVVMTAAASFIVVAMILAFTTFMVKRAETRATSALADKSDLLYTADMTLAFQAFNNGWPNEARESLDQCRPTATEPDRRGLEWYLLNGKLSQPSVTTLVGHKGHVNELAIFPDRERLASVGVDGTLRIWNLRFRELERTFQLSDEALSSVAISPTGRYVAAGGHDVFLCDLENSRQVQTIFHSGNISESLAFSPDGSQLVIGTHYDAVCIVGLDGHVINRVASGSRMATLEFTPDGKSLVFSGRRKDQRGIIQKWKADLSKREADLDDARNIENMTHARVSPDGKYLAIGGLYDCKACICNFPDGGVIGETPPSRDKLIDMAFSPNGKSLAIGFYNGQVECYDVLPFLSGIPAITRLPRVFTAHEGEVSCVRFLDNRSFVTCGADGCIRMITLPQRSEVGFKVSDSLSTGVAVSPTGRLALCTTEKGCVLVNLANKNQTPLADGRAEYHMRPAWSPTGDRAAVGVRSGSVSVVDSAGQVLYKISLDTPAESVAFSPDGKLLAIAAGQNLQVYQAGDGALVTRRPLPRIAEGVAFSHDSRRLACAGQHGMAEILNVPDFQPSLTLNGVGDARCIAFSRDDRLLATGHTNSTIRLWDTSTGRALGELVGHEKVVSHVAFSADGRTLLSASNDGTIRAWSVEHRRSYGIVDRRVGRATTDVNTNFDLSADGQTLAFQFLLPEVDGSNFYVWKLNDAIDNN